MIRMKDDYNVYLPVDVKRYVDMIINECNKLFNDGIEKGYFDNDKTASEHTAMLLKYIPWHYNDCPFTYRQFA